MYTSLKAIEYECVEALLQLETPRFSKRSRKENFELGRFFSKEKSGSKCTTLANLFFLQAASNGYIPAMLELGIRAELADRPEKAFAWYKKADLAGSNAGTYLLGLMYQEGEGVDRDLMKATLCYEAAARRGSQLAQIALTAIRQSSVDHAKGSLPHLSSLISDVKSS